MTMRRLATGVRRVIFFSLVGVSTLTALFLLSGAVQTDGVTPLELIMLVLYALLFAWICSAFWTATIGFILLLFDVDRFQVGHRTSWEPGFADPSKPSRTALVMPVYNENPQRVFAGIRATWESLLATGEHENFDFFILSDTRDPDLWVEEELRWRRLCADLNAGGRIFYRNRPQNTGRKTGNLADFVRRWGARYRYMIVLDADSVMAGATLRRMVQLMDTNPRVALIQVPPVPVNHASLFARILQFAGSLYSGMYTAGLNFWQAGEGNYWGHNAIVRIEPFAQHCGLPHLPGREPFGGEILSHDFVEAALLRRAGWKLWLAYDLEGSYEELPPTLIDYAKRDRRWCQGNLQHMRLVIARGFHPLHRVHLVMGVMSYLASPLWLLFLLVSGFEAYLQAQVQPVYFFGETLFPVWPVSYRVEMATVLVVTLIMLFLPKGYAVLLLLLREPRKLRQYGGFIHVCASVVTESLFSVLLAPVLMLFQTKFVLAILFRKAIGWPPQRRGDHATGLVEAVQAHGGHTLAGIGAGLITYYYVPSFFWWFTPVLLGLLCAVPLSMISSRVGAGQAARRQKLFLTPYETNRPPELKRLDELLKAPPLWAEGQPAGGTPWRQAILDPYVHALHMSLLPDEQLNRRQHHHLEGLLFQLMDEGEAGMAGNDRRELIAHRDSLFDAHATLWARGDET